MKELNRREFMAGAMAGAFGMTMSPGVRAAGAASPAQRPNFIVLLADDMGAKELSCYGNAVHRTPNLDKLAETGVKFETGYAAPLCHPTRVMLMTGQYGCHNGVLNFANRRGGPAPDAPAEDIAKSHVTFANLLKRAGYATALSGKWQLSGRQPGMIRECDFDEYCMWAYKADLPKGVTHTGGWEGNGKDKPARYWNPCVVKNGEYVPTKPDDYGPDLHHDFVVDFMKRNKEKPFCVYYTMCLTHAPHLPTPDTLKPGMDRHKHGPENFKGCIEYADKLVGKLTTALDELGLRENTVVFFAGDNGTGGEGKAQPTELGARVPMIINGPGIVKQRGATMELTDLSDVLPTMMDLAGVKLPEHRVIDGKSLAPFLLGKSETTREWIHSFLGDARILRTKRWLLEDNTPLHYGRLYDCGDSRNGVGYREVTREESPEVLAVKEQFKALLDKLPAPVLSEEGAAGGPKPGRGEARKAKRAAGEE